MDENTQEIDLNGNFTQLDYMYGLDNERRKMTEVKTVAGEVASTRTKYYSQNYEKVELTEGGTTTNLEEVNYIFAPDGLAAIYEKVSNKLYFVASDALGSINMIVDGTTGNIVSDMSYDAWGRRRNAQDWSYNNISVSSITDRGYTMHEMLDNFDLINMNGRAYDPLVGQFLSPDPFVQSPANPQSYNRYAYCLNNPLKYTDPSGYMTWSEWIDPKNKFEQAWNRMLQQNIETGFNAEYARQWEQNMSAIRTMRNWEYMQDLWAQTGKGLFDGGMRKNNVPMLRDGNYSRAVENAGYGESPKGLGTRLFESAPAAAYAWGMKYNGVSIERNREYFSFIMKVRRKGEYYYKWTRPIVGYDKSIPEILLPNKPPKRATAWMHSHGAWDYSLVDNYGIDWNNEFSEDDQQTIFDTWNLPGYAATTNGSLLYLCLEHNKDRKTLYTDMPPLRYDLPADFIDPSVGTPTINEIRLKINYLLVK